MFTSGDWYRKMFRLAVPGPEFALITKVELLVVRGAASLAE